MNPGFPRPLAVQLPALESQKLRHWWLVCVCSGQMGNKAVRGSLRAGLMKSSFISGHVLLPVFFRVQLLTSSVPYLCSTVSTGLSVYRNKTTVSNFASAGGKAAVSLCTLLFMSQGHKRKSISRNLYLSDLNSTLASVLLGFVSCSTGSSCDFAPWFICCVPLFVRGRYRCTSETSGEFCSYQSIFKILAGFFWVKNRAKATLSAWPALITTYLAERAFLISALCNGSVCCL